MKPSSEYLTVFKFQPVPPEQFLFWDHTRVQRFNMAFYPGMLGLRQPRAARLRPEAPNVNDTQLHIGTRARMVALCPEDWLCKHLILTPHPTADQYARFIAWGSPQGGFFLCDMTGETARVGYDPAATDPMECVIKHFVGLDDRPYDQVLARRDREQRQTQLATLNGLADTTVSPHLQHCYTTRVRRALIWQEWINRATWAVQALAAVRMPFRASLVPTRLPRAPKFTGAEKSLAEAAWNARTFLDFSHGRAAKHGDITKACAGLIDMGASNACVESDGGVMVARISETEVCRVPCTPDAAFSLAGRVFRMLEKDRIRSLLVRLGHAGMLAGDWEP